jgi:hypothetical protein
VPDAYIELRLCREVYHCAPSVLDEQDPEEVEAHLTCLTMEAKVGDWERRDRILSGAEKTAS